MSEEVEINAPVLPAAEPLFSVDLGSNGGVFAPTTVQELTLWIEKEMSFWMWMQNLSASGNHKASLDRASQPLRQAQGFAQEVERYALQNDKITVNQRVADIRRLLNETFIENKWPHSTTPIAKTAESLRIEEPLTAIAYLYVMVPASQGYQFDARDVASWRGFLLGVSQRFNISDRGEVEIESQRQAFDELRANSDQFLGEKKKIIEHLHREFAQIAAKILDAETSQKTEFHSMVDASQVKHEQALTKHESEMEALRKTFREAMTLRAPVEYWKAKATAHTNKSNSWMKWTFGSMTVLAMVIGLLAWWVFSTLTDGKPDAWKVAVLVLVGVLGVWAVRLVVRMFLSHLHLATDAEERVTMVQTYLALLEGDKMPSDEDRKLVLAPLFRPATDGLVKDEGLPHPMLELFTRTQSR